MESSIKAHAYAMESLEDRLLLSAGPRQMEYLDRGVIAVNKTSSTVYVSWRLLGTDPQNIAFNLYRSTNGATAVKRNTNPITATTDFTDTSVTESSTNAYFVKPVINGIEQVASESWTIVANTPVKQFLSIPLTAPPMVALPDGSTYTYNANDASVGDVDGDGQYEIFLKWDPSNSKDNSQSGYTGPTFLDCYRLDGTRLWRVNLGQNIRSGAHYEPFEVYDFDGDGRAEMAIRTAPSTIDGQGNPVLMGSDKVTDDYRNRSGYVLTGPEYLTIFSGLTGANLATVALKPDRGSVTQWGDSYGNRVDRFTASVAYLDGQRPSLIMGRGYYDPQSPGGQARNEVTAWNFRDGQLTMLWWFKAGLNISGNINSDYIHMGAHSQVIGDMDGDGKDEVGYGAASIDDTGARNWNTGLGHGDALFMTDMDPSRLGEEIYQVHEVPSLYQQTQPDGSIIDYGGDLRSALTGQPLFNIPGNGDDVGRGNAFDIDPRYPGFEMWTSSDGGIYNVSGVRVQDKPGNMFQNFGIWWDADPLRELLDGTTISDWKITAGVGGRSNFDLDPNASGTQSAPGDASNNGTKSTPSLVADLLGDWREEAVWRRADNSALDIYTTNIPAANRYVTLMQDTQYRESVAWQNSGYNQPTSTSFFLGAADSAGTPSTAPQPYIYTVPLGQAAVNVPVGITGRVFEDLNDDGIQNGSERWVNDAVVYIDANNNGQRDSTEQAVATDTQGIYTFTGVANGSYTIRATIGSDIATAVESATFSGSPVTLANLPMERIVYAGTSGADSFLVRKNTTGQYEVLSNGVLLSTLSAAIPSLSFDATPGNDLLTIDALNSTPIPAGGILFDGAAGTDSLILKGTPSTDTVALGAGAITFNGATIALSADENISYIGQGGADALSANGASGADVATFDSGVITLNGLTIDHSGDTSLAYLGQGGGDTITINGGLPVALPDVMLQNVTINSPGAATLPAATAGGISARTINALAIDAGGTLNVLSASSAANRSVLVVSTLSAIGGLDLANNDMIVRAGDLATIDSRVAAGANLASGYWNGAGIRSSEAAGDATRSTALGVLGNDNGAGGALYPTFDGQPSALGDVLVKFTYYGDADLNGAVNTVDFNHVAQNFNATSRAWGQGDFNYDGKVNAIDFNALATRFGSALPAGIAPAASGVDRGDLFATNRIIGNLAESILA